jgi:hypothetical protein
VNAAFAFAFAFALAFLWEPACQPTNLFQMHPIPVGAGLPAMAALHPTKTFRITPAMWRGSLLPLGCEAAPKSSHKKLCLSDRVVGPGARLRYLASLPTTTPESAGLWALCLVFIVPCRCKFSVRI